MWPDRLILLLPETNILSLVGFVGFSSSLSSTQKCVFLIINQALTVLPDSVTQARYTNNIYTNNMLNKFVTYFVHTLTIIVM